MKKFTFIISALLTAELMLALWNGVKAGGWDLVAKNTMCKC